MQNKKRELDEFVHPCIRSLVDLWVKVVTRWFTGHFPRLKIELISLFAKLKVEVHLSASLLGP